MTVTTRMMGEDERVGGGVQERQVRNDGDKETNNKNNENER